MVGQTDVQVRMSLPERPITILIAALGGEGGGVMADWLMEAATRSGLPAQATSIPGVAQRTGATTYYLEIFPIERARLGGREPVMSLTPTPGNVDIMVASELVEAGRAMANGYVSPTRTTLIASTHRIYATVEKMQMADGRYDGARVVEAARQLAQRSLLFDMRKLAQESGTVINAVLFGAVAGSGGLPLKREACEEAIRQGGAGAAAARDRAARGDAARAEKAARVPGRALCKALRAAHAALPRRGQPPRRRSGAPPRTVDGLRGHRPRRRSEDAGLSLRKDPQGGGREGWRAGGGDRLPQARHRGIRVCLAATSWKEACGVGREARQARRLQRRHAHQDERRLRLRARALAGVAAAAAPLQLSLPRGTAADRALVSPRVR